MKHASRVIAKSAPQLVSSRCILQKENLPPGALRLSRNLAVTPCFSNVLGVVAGPVLDFGRLRVGFKCRGGPPPFDSTLRRGEFGSDLNRNKQPAAAANQQCSSSSSSSTAKQKAAAVAAATTAAAAAAKHQSSHKFGLHNPSVSFSFWGVAQTKLKEGGTAQQQQQSSGFTQQQQPARSSNSNSQTAAATSRSSNQQEVATATAKPQQQPAGAATSRSSSSNQQQQ